ncbi:hypothetical protein MRX96_050933 [Rhipicephalus microplus]
MLLFVVPVLLLHQLVHDVVIVSKVVLPAHLGHMFGLFLIQALVAVAVEHVHDLAMEQKVEQDLQDWTN